METPKKKPTKKIVAPPFGTEFYLKSGGTNSATSKSPMLYWKDKSGVEHKLEFREYGHAVKLHRTQDRKRRVELYTSQVNQLLKNSDSPIVVKVEDVDNGRTTIGRMFHEKTSPEDAVKALTSATSSEEFSSTSSVLKSSDESAATKKSKSKKSKSSKKSKKSKSTESTESSDDEEVDYKSKKSKSAESPDDEEADLDSSDDYNEDDE